MFFIFLFFLLGPGVVSCPLQLRLRCRLGDELLSCYTAPAPLSTAFSVAPANGPNFSTLPKTPDAGPFMRNVL